LRDELFGFQPLSTRGAFLADRDGCVRYAWVTEDPSVLPEVDALLEAARRMEA
jgi:glutaredoxin-dependent peroxiredoxin